MHIALCELHGNCNLERCDTCGNEYLRDSALKRMWLPNHLTGIYSLSVSSIVVNTYWNAHRKKV